MPPRTTTKKSRAAPNDAGSGEFVLALDRSQLCQALAARVRQAVSHDGLAIALSREGEELPVLQLANGFDDEGAALAARLHGEWAQAIASGAVQSSFDEGVQHSVAIPGSRGSLGVITVRAATPDAASHANEHGAMLASIAAEAGAALERIRLSERAEARRRTEAVGEVVAGIAHELRNPLFGISSAAQLLRFRSRDDPVLERNVGRILREVERLNGMVTELLEFGRPQSLELAPGNPDEVLDYIVEGNRGLLERNSLQLERERKGKASVRFDAERMGTVFVNLLSNACEAAPEGSTLTVRSRALPGGGWRCTVHNEGPGIAADDLRRVFDIFYSTKPGGSGIGLALCRRILDEHGGEIRLESADGGGVTAVVVLN
jgi:signal transduction histidine kinase